MTDDLIAFAQEEDDTMIDCIPLKEAEGVQEMSKFKSSVDKAKFLNAFMITTSSEGSNEGRTYYLQAESEEECSRLATTLSEMAARALKRAQTESQFRKVQFVAKNVYTSNYFQLSSAILILAVSSLHLSLSMTCLLQMFEFTELLDKHFGRANC